MENLSVRTLYDKIDDQNMFLTAQLSRHQDDMEKFYETICQQNDQLKDLLDKTDFSKVHKIKRFGLMSETKLLLLQYIAIN